MKCPECGSEEGTYQEIEDLNNDLDYICYTVWHCDGCHNYVYQSSEHFIWPDE